MPPDFGFGLAAPTMNPIALAAGATGPGFGPSPSTSGPIAQAGGIDGVPAPMRGPAVPASPGRLTLDYGTQYFVSKGYTPEQAQGMTQRLLFESGGGDPNAYNPAGGGMGAYGLEQARGDRQRRMVEMYGPTPTVQQQLDFAEYELNTTERAARDALKKARTPQEAYGIMTGMFERPGHGTPGGPGGSTAYDQQRADIRAQEQDINRKIGALSDKIGALDTRDPESLKELRHYREEMERYQQQALQLAQHPPSFNPGQSLTQQGGMALVIGLLGGLLTKRPLIASLKAGGAALDAYNKGDQETYQREIDKWKVSADAMFKMAEFEHQMYADTLKDEQLTEGQKLDKLKAQAQLLENQSVLTRAESGNLDAVQNHADSMALRLAQFDLQRQRLEGGGAGQKLEASKQIEILDKDGNVLRTVLARESRDKAGWIDSGTGQPIEYNPDKGENLREITPSAAGGGRAGQQIERQIIGGIEVLSDLQNAMLLPLGTTIGPLGQYQPGVSLMGALRGDLAREMTPQDNQLMQKSMANLSRELSILLSPVYGGHWAAEQIDPLIPKSGENLATVMFDFARIKQTADNALEVVEKSPILSNDQKQQVKSFRSGLNQAIPWSPAEAVSFAHRDTPPTESFGDFVKAGGLKGGGGEKIPTAAVGYLKAHPDARGDFDAKFGSGEAAKILGQ